MSSHRSAGLLASGLGLFLAAVVLIAHFSVGLGVRTVLSASMRPAFDAGDRIVTVDRQPQRVHRGDVVVVSTPDMTAPLAHRVADVKVIADSVSVRTKGDANADADGWTNLLPGSQVPVVVAVLPGVLPGVPSTWGPGPKVLLVALVGLGATLLMVLPQWRRRSCDCEDCTPSAAPACPSCGSAPPQDTPPQDAPPQDAPPQDAPPQDAPPHDGALVGAAPEPLPTTTTPTTNEVS